ncbi:hypothetical protein F5B20DRAFT_530771 [Whalleya microplaca]|nr:hypothetical protein F5B20DRAFT_530771 [Whalleya microplaca]
MKVLRLLMLGAFVASTNADGGYNSNCKNIAVTVRNGHLALRADCKTNSGSTQCSLLDLNDCYGTDNGYVKPKDGGHFNDLCLPEKSRLDGSKLWNYCRKKKPGQNPGTRRTWIDTNELITSDNGTLKCFEHRATTPTDCAKISQASRAGVSWILGGMVVYWIFGGICLLWTR